MTTTAPSPDAARVLSYLRSDKGQRDRRNLMDRYGNQRRAFREITVYVLGRLPGGRLRDPDELHVFAVADECIIAELGRAEEPQRCA